MRWRSWRCSSATRSAFARAGREAAADPGAPRIDGELDRASRRLDASRIHPSELRHSFWDWAQAEGRIVRPTEGGIPLAEVAAVMGHLTPRTTKVFSEGNEIPPMIALPLRPHHPADPILFEVARETATRSSSR